MRRAILVLASPLFGLGFAANGTAEWSPDVRLTDDPAVSATEIDGGRNVVVSDQLVVVVWSDDRDGNSEIYFQERILGTWESATRLTNDPAASTHPAIGLDGDEVRVVWEDSRTGHPEVRLKRRVLGGWLPDSCLTCDPFESARPALDHTGTHLAWEETKDGNREIYFRRLPMDGPWESEFRVSNDAQESSHPCVASPRFIGTGFDRGARMVAWQDHRHGNWEIYARFGLDFLGWGPETRVSFAAGDSRFPSVAVEEDAFCGDIAFTSHWVAWQDDRGGMDAIDFAEGADGFWYPASRISNTTVPARHPTIGKTYVPFFGPFGAGLCGQPTVAWEERMSATAGSVLHFDFSVGVVETLSAVGADAENVSIAVHHEMPSFGVIEGKLAALWTDARDGNEEIYFAEATTLVDATGAPEVVPPGSAIELGPAHPNPFRSSTTATIRVANETELSVRIVDAAGRCVRELFSRRVPPGVHPIEWDGTATSGSRAASGTYFFVVESNGATVEQRVVRLR